MLNYGTKIDNNETSAGVVVAKEYNSIMSEQKNTVKPFLQLDELDNSQTVKAIDMASKAMYYSDTGTANSIILSRGATTETIETLFEGMVIIFRPANINTGATTIKIKTLDAKPLYYDGLELTAGFLSLDKTYTAIYSTANGRFNIQKNFSEADSKPTLSIGTILNGYTIFNNCIVAFGGEFNRADYPKLWAYLQANPSLVKTQAQWTTENTTNGICGYFSSGNGTTTFRVPNLDKAFLRPDSRTVGTYQADELKSHTHNSKFQFGAYGGNTYTALGSTGDYAGSATAASGGAETRPKNIAVLPLIVAK